MKKFLAILLAAASVSFAGGVYAADDKPAAPVAEVKAPVAVDPAAKPAEAAPAAAPAAAVAAPAAEAAPAAAPAPTVNKGDTAWMLVATAMVTLMTIPGLALFYGGLVRTKNML